MPKAQMCLLCSTYEPMVSAISNQEGPCSIWLRPRQSSGLWDCYLCFWQFQSSLLGICSHYERWSLWVPPGLVYGSCGWFHLGQCIAWWWSTHTMALQALCTWIEIEKSYQCFNFTVEFVCPKTLMMELSNSRIVVSFKPQIIQKSRCLRCKSLLKHERLPLQ